mgnify:CR=1 FL=1
MTSKIHTITAAFDAAELKKQNVLGKKIAESRVSSGMIQKELAGKLASYNISISPASISKWEKGDALPQSIPASGSEPYFRDQ